MLSVVLLLSVVFLLDEMAESGVQVKQEHVEAVELESRILELCEKIPNGINDSVIQNDLPQFDAEQRVMAINRLLSTGKIVLMKSGSQPVYKLKDPSAASKGRGGDAQEQIVFQIIEKAGNKGIWTRHIRMESNLPESAVNKNLKSLESKKLIKAVKSVTASKRKVYMLYNLEPDRSVTGGAWYSDQDFESEFVEVLNQQCFKFLEQRAAAANASAVGPIAQRNASYASSLEVTKYIAELGISKVKLSVEDIETILNTLIYDGKVERSIVAGGASEGGDDNQTKLYRAVPHLIQPTALVRGPCGVCPVFNECTEGGIISPSTCVYMKEWLQL